MLEKYFGDVSKPDDGSEESDLEAAKPVVEKKSKRSWFFCCKGSSYKGNVRTFGDMDTDLDEEEGSVFMSDPDDSVEVRVECDHFNEMAPRGLDLAEVAEAEKRSKFPLISRALFFIGVYIKRYKNFVNSPRVHFVFDASFFIIFLMLFSYMMLCKFTFEEEVEIRNKSTNESSSDAGQVVMIKTVPSFIEYFLLFWVVSLFIEEGRQFISSETDSKLKNKLFRYFNDRWNYLDLCGCLAFILAFIVRTISSIFSSKEIFLLARIIYVCDLSLWFLRLLHVTIVFRTLGPKLVMIQKMLYDLLFFILFISVFVCSFGITTQALMYPGNELNFDLFKNILNKAYWPIYGEMKILEEIQADEEECKATELGCPDQIGTVYSFLSLMVYMVVANVLLINLLIAMFSSTFEDVQVKTDQIWMFQRYRLVFEYFDSTFLPPPISYLEYCISLFKYFTSKNEDKSSQEEDLGALISEKKYAEEYVRQKEREQRETAEFRLKWNNDKIEELEKQMIEMHEWKSKEMTEIKNLVMKLNERIDKLPYIPNEIKEIEYHG